MMILHIISDCVKDYTNLCCLEVMRVPLEMGQKKKDPAVITYKMTPLRYALMIVG